MNPVFLAKKQKKKRQENERWPQTTRKSSNEIYLFYFFTDFHDFVFVSLLEYGKIENIKRQNTVKSAVSASE